MYGLVGLFHHDSRPKDGYSVLLALQFRGFHVAFCHGHLDGSLRHVVWSGAEWGMPRLVPGLLL